MDDANCLWSSRERRNSSLFHFNSGHEASQRVNNGTANVLKNTAFPFPEKEGKIAPSPKSGRRTRKLSLFSFHLNSKEKEDKGKTRRNSQPASYVNQPSPTRLSPPVLDMWPGDKADSNGSLSSLASSPSSSRKCSSVMGVVERDNLVIQDIIQETLKLQFENVTEYKREICDRLAKNVSQLVKRRVEVMKEVARLPCKIVSVVYVGAIREHGIEIVSQASLESDKDNFTVASYRNGKVFAVGGVMAIPLEK